MISKHRLEDKVKLLGYVDAPKELISQSSLLVLPSYHEAMPYSVIEALCLNTPVIVTHYAAAKECIAPEYIVSGNSDEDICENLAAKMKTVLNSNYSFEYSQQCFRKMQPAHVVKRFHQLIENQA